MTLEEKIKYHQDKYYNDSPEISDAEFDALWDRLKKENPDSSLLKGIGDTTWSGWPKADHLMMMGSQDKFNNEKDFRDWLRVKGITFPIALQYKLDGLSIEIQYENGKLIKAVTRGDGKKGDDVTPNVIKMQGVPSELLDNNFTGSVRGEIVLDRDTFNEHFADAKNPRNMASGITKRKGGEESEYLTVITYDVFSPKSNIFKKEFDKIQFLVTNRFIPVNTEMCYTPEELLKSRDEIIAKRDTLLVDIDGLVLKQDAIVESDSLRKRPEYQRAFKFDTEQSITKVIGIEWSRSGYNYTPVAILEPIDLMGSIVKRASLANLDNIAKLGLKVNDEVLIHKAGEIIPQILKVVTEGDNRYDEPVPCTCLECGEELKITGARVYCPNLDCSGRTFHRVEKWIAKTGVKGFGPALLNFLFDNKFVTKLIDLYTLDIMVVLGSTNLKKATEKAFTKLYNIKELKLETFVSGWDIEGIGEGVVKFAVNAGYDTLEKLRDATVADFMKVDGFSEGRATLLYEAMKELYDDMYELSHYVGIKEPVKIVEEDDMNKLDGKSFCFTGKLENMTRNEASEMVISKGGTVKSGVSAGLDFLVTNTPDSGSSKNKKAESLGTEIITEGQFMMKLI